MCIVNSRWIISYEFIYESTIHAFAYEIITLLISLLKGIYVPGKGNLKSRNEVGTNANIRPMI